MTTTGWAWTGSTSVWPGQTLPTLSETHHCHQPALPYKLMSWRPLVYNITSPYFIMLKWLKILLIYYKIYFVIKVLDLKKKSCYFPNKFCDTLASPSIHNCSDCKVENITQSYRAFTFSPFQIVKYFWAKIG